ncbi:DUF1850 domain-containing protein [Palaeococcus pacificus]|nr:DUF1850 domain-containing protein [Palaeococcus pacificus]
MILPFNVLIISNGDSSHTYLLGEKTVTISYIHSVQRSEIVEVLKANGSGLYAVEMKWKDFGAGLPEDIQYTEDGYYVKRINIYLGKSLSFWFIPFNQAKIKVGSKLVFAPTEETVMEFKVKKCLFLFAILGRC